MAKPGDAGKRFLDLYRRAGRGNDVPVGVGSEVSWTRSFYRVGAEQLHGSTDVGAGQKISAEGRKNKKSIRDTLELRRFGEGAADAWFRTEPRLAGLSKRSLNHNLVNCNSYIAFAVHGSRTSPRTVLLDLEFNYVSVRPERVEGLRVNCDTVSMAADFLSAINYEKSV